MTATGAALRSRDKQKGDAGRVLFKLDAPSAQTNRMCAPPSAQHTKKGLLASSETAPVPLGPMEAAAVAPPSRTDTDEPLNSVGMQ